MAGLFVGFTICANGLTQDEFVSVIASINEYAFNATALHELAHSSGHPTRLNRPQSAFFGRDQYAYEELVAEMFGRKKKDKFFEY